MTEGTTETDTTPTEGESTTTDTPEQELSSDETTTEADDTTEDGKPEDDESDVFPRSYVEELREESKRYRHRAQRVDDYAHRLHTELIRGTGRLADPTDLTFDEAHIDNPEALTAAIDDLLVRKPHLAARRPTGEIGQGATKSADTVNLAALLRRQAL